MQDVTRVADEVSNDKTPFQQLSGSALNHLPLAPLFDCHGPLLPLPQLLLLPLPIPWAWMHLFAWLSDPYEPSVQCGVGAAAEVLNFTADEWTTVPFYTSLQQTSMRSVAGVARAMWELMCFDPHDVFWMPRKESRSRGGCGMSPLAASNGQRVSKDAVAEMERLQNAFADLWMEVPFLLSLTPIAASHHGQMLPYFSLLLDWDSYSYYYQKANQIKQSWLEALRMHQVSQATYTPSSDLWLDSWLHQIIDYEDDLFIVETAEPDSGSGGAAEEVSKSENNLLPRLPVVECCSSDDVGNSTADYRNGYRGVWELILRDVDEDQNTALLWASRHHGSATFASSDVIDIATASPHYKEELLLLHLMVQCLMRHCIVGSMHQKYLMMH